MKIRQLIVMVTILLIGMFASTVSGKRLARQPVAAVSKDGIEYSAPSEPDKIGYVIATWQKTQRVIWSRQIYVVKYEYAHGLEQDVQWCFISKLRIADDKLIVTNDRGYEYELDLTSLGVKVLRGTSLLDNTNLQPPVQ